VNCGYSLHILLAAIIHDDSHCKNMGVKNGSVKMHKKNLSLAVKLNVTRHTDTGEHSSMFAKHYK
jgi:hypothetical protein